MRLTAVLLAVFTSLAVPAQAEDRVTLGWGRIMNNDLFGDGRDRWRTSSYTVSLLRGTDWQGQRPDRFGELIEYRWRAEMIAPRRLTGPTSADRAFVGAASFGVHTHWSRGDWDLSAGMDIVAIGPQTGMLDLQSAFHDLINEPGASDFVEANQAPDSFHPTALAEMSRPVQISNTLSFRPFAEVQAGVEDIARVGFDVLLGETGQRALKLRDPVTGQLYHGITVEDFGWSYALGADYAVVGDSAYFPAAFGTVPLDERWRLRAGAYWQGTENVSFFYGITYLSEEYEGQDEGQMVGSLKLNFNF